MPQYKMESASDSLGWPAVVGIVAGIAVLAWFVVVPILQRAGSPAAAATVPVEPIMNDGGRPNTPQQPIAYDPGHRT